MLTCWSTHLYTACLVLCHVIVGAVGPWTDWLRLSVIKRNRRDSFLFGLLHELEVMLPCTQAAHWLNML